MASASIAIDRPTSRASPSIASPRITGATPLARASLAAASRLARGAGLDVLETGGLATARYLEPVAALNIALGYGAGLGTDIAPAWLRAA